ncbi:MAG: GatB/YqeY domain-containing protein [Flammeovirgaceae bacterium]
MSLKEKIQSEMKTAMKAKDQDALRALRAIKSMILLAETEKGASEELTEDAEMKLLTKAVKQRRDSAQIYKEQGRDDLYEKEVSELNVIERFLPEQLSDEDVAKIVRGIISEVGASSMKDMGKVMGLSTKKLAGQADPKLISTLVKSILSGN